MVNYNLKTPTTSSASWLLLPQVLSPPLPPAPGHAHARLFPSPSLLHILPSPPSHPTPTALRTPPQHSTPTPTMVVTFN